jgi:hypothetical protein
LLSLVLVTPEACEANGCTKPLEICLLLARDRKRSVIVVLCSSILMHGHQSRPSHPMNFGLGRAFFGCLNQFGDLGDPPVGGA